MKWGTAGILQHAQNILAAYSDAPPHLIELADWLSRNSTSSDRKKPLADEARNKALIEMLKGGVTQENIVSLVQQTRLLNSTQNKVRMFDNLIMAATTPELKTSLQDARSTESVEINKEPLAKKRWWN